MINPYNRMLCNKRSRVGIEHTFVLGEKVRIDQFELTVEEATLLGGAKAIAVRTIY